MLPSGSILYHRPIGESVEIRAPHIINNLAMRKRMF